MIAKNESVAFLGGQWARAHSGEMARCAVVGCSEVQHCLNHVILRHSATVAWRNGATGIVACSDVTTSNCRRHYDPH